MPATLPVTAAPLSTTDAYPRDATKGLKAKRVGVRRREEARRAAMVIDVKQYRQRSGNWNAAGW